MLLHQKLFVTENVLSIGCVIEAESAIRFSVKIKQNKIKKIFFLDEKKK